jgi:TRAP-type C4-dicarboxylate transport system substrate-binding protein
MGAIPITTLGSEVYTSMERGTIDCVSISEPSGISWKIQEVTKFITRVNFVTGAYPLMFSLKTWDSLPKDMQNIISQAGREAELNIDKESLRYQKDVIDQAIMKAGIEIVPLDEGERARMKKACAPVWDEWLAKNGPVFNGLGKKMFDIVGQTIGKP